MKSVSWVLCYKTIPPPGAENRYAFQSPLQTHLWCSNAGSSMGIHLAFACLSPSCPKYCLIRMYGRSSDSQFPAVFCCFAFSVLIPTAVDFPKDNIGKYFLPFTIFTDVFLVGRHRITFVIVAVTLRS